MNRFQFKTGHGKLRFISKVFYSQKQQPRTDSFHKTNKAFARASSGGFGMLAIPIVSFSLAIWQVQRRNEKLEKIEWLEEKTKAPAVPLPNSLEEIEELEYQKVTVRGRFIHEQELLISPRSNVNCKVGDPGVPDLAYNYGSYVITPFKTTDGRTIIVNRGFVKKRQINPTTRAEGQITNEIELTGVVRKSEKKNFLVADNSKTFANDGILNYRDINFIANFLQCEPIFIDAIRDCNVPGGPDGGQTRVDLRNMHLSYICTWVSLGVLTLILWKKRYYNLTSLMIRGVKTRPPQIIR